MKKYFVYGVAALALVSCSNEILIDEAKQDAQEVEIGFSTFTDVATKADNSSAVLKHNLESYHESFMVWGIKSIGGTAESSWLFDDQEVNYSTDKWVYTPLRFWDKSASGYDFYAAAPYAKPTAEGKKGWVWNKTDKTLSYLDLEMNTLNIAKTTQANTIDNAAVFDEKDLMIATDVLGYNTYTTEKVNFTFNHILSRLNIGVKKDEILKDFTVKLNEVTVYNLDKVGSFDEKLPSGVTTADLKAGTVKRWTTTDPAETDATQYSITYNPTDATVVTDAYNYVYQSLVLPQTVGTQVVALDGKAHEAVAEVLYTDTDADLIKAINDSHLTTDANGVDPYEPGYVETYQTGYTKVKVGDVKVPASDAIAAVGKASQAYIVINYSIYVAAKNAVLYTYDEYRGLDGKSETTQEQFDALPASNKTKTPAVAESKIDDYVYYFNLANIFNGTATTGVDFNEGWQNTLKVNLKPTAIEFDADVYQWASKTITEVDVPDGGGL